MNHYKIILGWCLINLVLVSSYDWRGNSIEMADVYMKYRDENQAVEVRVEDLLSRMTLDEKIGQMTQIDRAVASFDVIKTYSIGNIFFNTNCFFNSSRH